MNKENIMETMDVDKTNEKQSNDKSSIEDELEVALVERNILLEMMKEREDLMVGKTDNKVKKKTIRCSFCNKKCNMINITCKCGGVFCQLHMSLSSHKCPKISGCLRRMCSNSCIVRPGKAISPSFFRFSRAPLK